MREARKSGVQKEIDLSEEALKAAQKKLATRQHQIEPYSNLSREEQLKDLEQLAVAREFLARNGINLASIDPSISINDYANWRRPPGDEGNRFESKLNFWALEGAREKFAEEVLSADERQNLTNEQRQEVSLRLWNERLSDEERKQRIELEKALMRIDLQPGLSRDEKGALTRNAVIEFEGRRQLKEARAALSKDPNNPVLQAKVAEAVSQMRPYGVLSASEKDETLKLLTKPRALLRSQLLSAASIDTSLRLSDWTTRQEDLKHLSDLATD
ncbi:MAG TPA: hypothetical protein VEF04_21085, partial [Blastocatellia bacterium]|nr:hypothetical protein [Blastocatellia bacterium]